MQFVSSDTNVWIDFKTISRLHLPFLLPYTYIMYTESMESELLSPAGFQEELKSAGLMGVDITLEEFFLADSWGSVYPKLSVQDRIALAIAKQRKIPLLTGDMRLRKAAALEGVEVFGTIRVLDELYHGAYIDWCEYRSCLEALLRFNGGIIRLPEKEIRKRMELLESG